MTIDELRDGSVELVPRAGYRRSDNGFLHMSAEEYLALLDWTARQPVSLGQCL